MKASDLLAILEHNDPGVLTRAQEIKAKLKHLESFDKCHDCGAHVHYDYRRTPGDLGDEIVVERGTCQGCFLSVPTRAFAIH